MIQEIINNIIEKCEHDDVINDIEGFTDIITLELGKYEIKEKETALVPYDERLNKGYTMFFVAKSVEGLSEKSLAYYRVVIDGVLKFINKAIDKVTTDDIRYYLACKKREGSSRVTLDNMRRVLNSFYEWLVAEQYIDRNPVKPIVKIKCDKVIKQPFSETELERIRDTCRKYEPEKEAKRRLAIIECLLSTGCRASELCSIKINDIDWAKGNCKVFGKGAKERLVFFNDKSLLRLKEYLDTREDKNEFLFVQNRKPYGKLSKESLERLIKDIGEKAEITGRTHPHRFRRTMACMALKKGMRIEQIQALLGHTKIETTQIYLCLDNESLAADHKKYLG